MKVYVDKMPDNCEECPLCQHGYAKIFRKNRYDEIRGCVLGDYLKYRFIDDEVDTCPLKPLPTDSKWEQLKKWLNEYVHFLEELKIKTNRRSGFILKGNFFDVSEILNKMQELEKGENND